MDLFDSMKTNLKSSHSLMHDKTLNNHSEQWLDEKQKVFVRSLLKRYEGRELQDREFRILQGVLTSQVGNL